MVPYPNKIIIIIIIIIIIQPKGKHPPKGTHNLYVYNVH